MPCFRLIVGIDYNRYFLDFTKGTLQKNHVITIDQ